MELDIIKLQTTWNDAAGSINSNYAKIADAIAQLKANGGGGGGGADIDLTDYATKVWVEAKGYITASALTPYAKTADVSITYATIASVQGFENRIGGLEGAVPQLNERVTIVEGKVSSLNETVSTGKNNLLDRVNTIETDYVTSGNLESAINGIDLSVYLLKADLTKSRIQSTLGISDWALAATKPSYAWSEITSRPTALSQFTDDVVAGKYLPLSGGNIVSDKELILTIISSSPNSYAMFYANGRNRVSVGYYNGLGCIANEISYARIGVTDTGEPQYWDSYRTDANKYTLLHSGNIGNYKSGDSAKLGGYDISRFLLTTKRDYTTMDLNTIGDKQSIFTEIRTGEVTTLNCPISGYGALLSLKDGNSYAKMQIVSASGSADTYIRCTQGSGSTISANWQRIITDNNIGNYNAGSATKLQTPCKLWGQSFDGTKDITLGLNLDGYKGTGTVSQISDLGDKGLVVSIDDKRNNYGMAFWVEGNGKGYIQQQAFGSSTTYSLCIQPFGGNVGIGTASPTEKLDVAGNVKASGNINATSITINGVTITASNGSITVNGNVLATGSITAKISA